MPTIPKIVHHAWLSNNEFGAKYCEWRKTWIRYNPDYSFMFWTMANLPLHRFSPSGQKLLAMDLKFVVKSDILRWELLWLFGGIWSDTDIEVQRCFDELINVESFAGVSYYPDGIGNALIGTVPGNGLIKEIRDATNEAIEKDIQGSHDNATLSAKHGACFVGRNFLCQIAKIYPRWYFYPMGFLASKEAKRAAYPQSYAVHRWTGTEKDGWGHVKD